MERPIFKKLIFRLSSLGDLVLASSAISTDKNSTIHWVVKKEFANLLDQHPGIDKVWEFDTASGVRGWLKLCGQLWSENYDEYVDLHKSLRTAIAKAYLLIKSQYGGRSFVWHSIQKQRLRLIFYFVFKSHWPKSLRPVPWVIRFSSTNPSQVSGKPNFSHLKREKPVFKLEPTRNNFKDYKGYLCVMPASRWKGKEWGIDSFEKSLKEITLNRNLLPVVLGTSKDTASLGLVNLMKRTDNPHYSGVGKWSLPEVADVLAHSSGYFGCDTGLAHLAEAVGVPAWVIYGPTRPDQGFGPWRPESLAIEKSLWCRPCGKDGRFCFRIQNRFLCLKNLSPDQVVRSLKI